MLAQRRAATLALGRRLTDPRLAFGMGQQLPQPEFTNAAKPLRAAMPVKTLADIARSYNVSHSTISRPMMTPRA